MCTMMMMMMIIYIYIYIYISFHTFSALIFWGRVMIMSYPFTAAVKANPIPLKQTTTNVCV